jgi:hypothetical protein
LLGFLFLGSAQASKHFSGLKDLGITHIANIAGKQHFQNDFKYARFFLEHNDSTDLLIEIPLILQFLEDAKSHNGRVLVHWLLPHFNGHS